MLLPFAYLETRVLRFELSLPIRTIPLLLLPVVVDGEEIRQRAPRADLAGAAAGLGGGGGGGGGRGVAAAGEGFGAAEVGRGREVVAVVVGGGGLDSGEAFAEAGGAEAGDGNGRVTVTGGEAVRFGSHVIRRRRIRRKVGESMLELKGNGSE